jgi:hypothetical protein
VEPDTKPLDVLTIGEMVVDRESIYRSLESAGQRTS